ncbi:MAG: hypothetical protein JNL11_02915 [Bdellovibrionaceae bacterium]|nr:hypothetical protein [Pseudobdellovibrionaceae bacterium]
MTNRNDVTAPTDTINKLKLKRHPKDSQALYGDDLSPDANAKAGVGDNPHLARKLKTSLTPPQIEDRAGRRIGKDPTESF